MRRCAHDSPDTGACMRSASSYSECACCVRFRAARWASSGKEEQRRRPASDAMPTEEKQVWRDSVVCPQQTDERWRTKRTRDGRRSSARQTAWGHRRGHSGTITKGYETFEDDKAAIDRARGALFHCRRCLTWPRQARNGNPGRRQAAERTRTRRRTKGSFSWISISSPAADWVQLSIARLGAPRIRQALYQHAHASLLYATLF